MATTPLRVGLTAQDCGNLPAFNFHFTNQTITAPTTFVNQHIRITGAVTFAADVTMQRCTVLLDPGADLIVGQNTTFVASGDAGGRTVFFGCTGMWHSIQVGQDAAVKFRSCTIRDGDFGIVFLGNYDRWDSELVDNQFTGNYRSISALFAQVGFAVFSGNNFSNYAFGTAFPLTLPPHTNVFPLTAIFANASTGAIGSSGQTGNTITGHRYGIYIDQSSLSFNNFFISHSWRVNNMSSEGSGILADRSTLTIQDKFGGQGCTFHNNQRSGIESRRTVQARERTAQAVDHAAAVIKPRLELVRASVETLSGNELYEANRKTVLLYALDAALEEAGDIDALRAVAEQCPASGGEAVVMARGLLPYEERLTFSTEGPDPFCVDDRATNRPEAARMLFGGRRSGYRPTRPIRRCWFR